MKTLTFARAIHDAIQEEMEQDEKVFLIGEDIGKYGGAFKITLGLIDKFTEKRVIDTPLSESAILGAALGAAIEGLKPIAEIMFADFFGVCFDNVVNQIARMHYCLAGQAKINMVIRAPYGVGSSSGFQHSQSVEAWFMNTAGLRIVIPSNAYDAKGLLKSAIRDCNPVIFLESKYLYKRNKEGIPNEEYLVPIDKAKIKKSGSDITIIAYGTTVETALKASEILLEEDKIETEVIDLISIKPIDEDTILSSVRKTGRALIIHEAPKTGGVGAEISAVISEKIFEYLKAPILRIGAYDAPVPFNPNLEKAYVPQVDQVVKATRELLIKN